MADKAKRLRIYFWLCVLGPFACFIITGICHVMSQRPTPDEVMLALARIDTSIGFMGFWIIAAIIALRLDSIPPDPSPDDRRQRQP